MVNLLHNLIYSTDMWSCFCIWHVWNNTTLWNFRMCTDTVWIMLTNKTGVGCFIGQFSCLTLDELMDYSGCCWRPCPKQLYEMNTNLWIKAVSLRLSYCTSTVSDLVRGCVKLEYLIQVKKVKDFYSVIN